MNPVIINLGIIEIRWYSVLILLGFILGYYLVINKCKQENIDKTLISDLCFYLIIVSILGARIYYCIFEWKYYINNPIDIIKIWEGGLAIHGGVIAGIIFIYFYTKKKKLEFLKLLDIFAPSLVLGQAIGRWGNFFNGEAYGPITTFENLKNLHIPKFIIDGMYIGGNYHVPTFFYESIGCLIVFIILIILRNKKSTKIGIITSIYFILYGLVRFFIEGLRTDSLMLFNIKVAQLISIIMILIGIYIIIKSLKKKI